MVLVKTGASHMRPLFSLIVWGTIVVIPLLLWAKVRFLVYHDNLISLLHALFIFLDICFLWPFCPCYCSSVEEKKWGDGIVVIWEAWKSHKVTGLFYTIPRKRIRYLDLPKMTLAAKDAPPEVMAGYIARGVKGEELEQA